jgi:alkylation response protein AidB-like acyl-CoA dehydrogenase
MDWHDTPQQADWRREVRTFLKTELPTEIAGRGRMFERPSKEGAWEKWRVALASRGWIAPHWPKEDGGAGMTPAEQFILNEEFAEAKAPSMGGLGVMMLGPTLVAHGTEEQKKQHLGAILRGESAWCQGYSEPGSGSDLASLQTRAVRDGDEFVVNGQKIWTSLAHEADWCFCLTRTDPDAPKHRGITYLLIDMKTPGITVRPLVNMANQHHFNEVFFEDVRVPVRNVVGEVNRGWYVGATTLDFERSSIGASVGARQEMEDSIGWLRSHKADYAPSTYASMRNEWTERWVEGALAQHLAYRVISMQVAGQIPNSEASIAKLYGSELNQRVARTQTKMLGMWGAITDARAPFGGESAVQYMGVIPSTIAGGTSEIQRNIIATRGLGLP